MAVHHLKTIGHYFDAVKSGAKTFEVRKNDRAFQTGDILELVRLDENGCYTMGEGGRLTTVKIWKRVTYLLQGGQFGIDAEYCVLGLGDCKRPEGDG